MISRKSMTNNRNRKNAKCIIGSQIVSYLAYQSEAALFGTHDIPPLRQTMDEVIMEFEHGILLKMESDNGKIIGSVRAKEDSGTVYIGKLMVHPDHRHLGYGTSLLKNN